MAPWSARCSCGRPDRFRVDMACVVELDRGGVCCASAQLAPGVGAHGEGSEEDSAVAELRVALPGLIDEFGVPREVIVDVAVSAGAAGVGLPESV